MFGDDDDYQDLINELMEFVQNCMDMIVDHSYVSNAPDATFHYL